MDDSLSLILQFVIPAVALAVAAGGFQWQVKHLTERDKEREAEFEEFREADRSRSHDLNLKLASALDSQAIATSKLLDFETRRGTQIDGNTRRSRHNRSRIESLEKRDHKSVGRKLAAAGVPEELRDEITDVMGWQVREPSSVTPVPKKAAESR